MITPNGFLLDSPLPWTVKESDSDSDSGVTLIEIHGDERERIQYGIGNECKQATCFVIAERKEVVTPRRARIIRWDYYADGIELTENRDLFHVLDSRNAEAEHFSRGDPRTLLDEEYERAVCQLVGQNFSVNDAQIVRRFEYGWVTRLYKKNGRVILVFVKTADKNTYAVLAKNCLSRSGSGETPKEGELVRFIPGVNPNMPEKRAGYALTTVDWVHTVPGRLFMRDGVLLFYGFLHRKAITAKVVRIGMHPALWDDAPSRFTWNDVEAVIEITPTFDQYRAVLVQPKGMALRAW
ncbi:MAG: hypothetical protein ACOCXQ_02390 [Patescibacteria group bacterium]